MRAFALGLTLVVVLAAGGRADATANEARIPLDGVAGI